MAYVLCFARELIRIRVASCLRKWKRAIDRKKVARAVGSI